MNGHFIIMIRRQVIDTLIGAGLPEQLSEPVAYTLMLAGAALVAWVATWLVRRSLLRFIHHLVRGSRIHWDDALVNNHFFHRLSWFVPVVIFSLVRDLLLPPDSPAADLLHRAILCGFVLVGCGALTALLNAVNEIYRSACGSSGKTIRGYVDAARLLVYVVTGILIISIISNRSPLALLSLMGGLTAVTMLVFRDSILGFIASVKLTGTDMIRVGDWIEMPSYNADGDVIEISIHSVRVRNWDKTITTIPTYALISQSFRNWRGMSESGGRRIKRSLRLDMTSIRFLDDRELEELARIQLISDYIQERQQEIDEYNRTRDIDSTILVNGRRQTNAGLFRAYVEAYLRAHPKIHHEMTFLVRQLEPAADGLPLQIYVFSKEQAWARYEAIQADIFDHLIAVLPFFHLRVFQQPSGHDLRMIGASCPEKSG